MFCVNIDVLSKQYSTQLIHQLLNCSDKKKKDKSFDLPAVIVFGTYYWGLIKVDDLNMV